MTAPSYDRGMNARSTPPPEPIDEATQVLRQFRQVFNAVKTNFQQAEKKSGLGGAQLWALSVIRDQAGLGITELARAMDIRQATASNLVRGLVERGFVVTARDTADRRAVQLRLEPAGARVLARTRGPHHGVLPDALARLPSATLRRLQRDLQALLDELGPDARAAQTPLADM